MCSPAALLRTGGGSAGGGSGLAVADAQGAGEVVDLVGEPAAEGGDEVVLGEGGAAEGEGFVVDGVRGEGGGAGGGGEGGAAAAGEAGGFLVVAVDVGADEGGLFGLPEALGGGGEEVVGEGVVLEHGVPGAAFGVEVGEGGAAAGGAFLAGGAGVGGEFGVDGGFVDGAEDGEAVQDAPAQGGVEGGAAGDEAVVEPGGEGGGLGGAVDEVADGDEAQSGVGVGAVGAALAAGPVLGAESFGAAEQVAAEGGEGGEGGGPVVGVGVDAGDVAGGEAEDAGGDGEVVLVREVGAGGVEVGGGGQFAVADEVAGGVPQDGAGEGVGEGGEAGQGGGPGGGVEAEFGVGEVLVVEDDEVGAVAGEGEGLVLGEVEVEVVAAGGGPASGVWSQVVTVMRWGRVPSRSTVSCQAGAGVSVSVAWAVRVSTPLVRSQAAAQVWTSRSVAEARLSRKSARVALAKRWRVKWRLMPARKSFSPSQAVSWRRAAAPLA